MANFICYHNYKDINRFAQQDKETATTQLEETDAQGYKWEGLEAAGNFNQGVLNSKTSMVKSSNNPISLTKRRCR